MTQDGRFYLLKEICLSNPKYSQCTSSVNTPSEGRAVTRNTWRLCDLKKNVFMLIASVLLSFLNTETAHKAAIWLTRSENYTRKQTIQDQILPKVDQKWVNWFLTYDQMALNWFCCFCFSKRCMESFSLIRLLNDGGLSECKSLGHWRSKSNSSVQQRRCQKWQQESECSFYQGKYCRFQGY